MKARIRSVGKDETMEYGAAFTVCANDEVIRNRLADGWPDGADSTQATDAAHGAAILVIINAGFDYRSELGFRAYNGGPRHCLVEVDWYVAEREFDEDGHEYDPEWRRAWLRGPGATAVPTEMIARLDAIVDAAADAMDAEMKRQVALELAKA